MSKTKFERSKPHVVSDEQAINAGWAKRVPGMHPLAAAIRYEIVRIVAKAHREEQQA